MLLLYLKCDTHPTYKVMRKPISKCKMCHFIWDTKQKAERLGYYFSD